MNFAKTFDTGRFATQTKSPDQRADPDREYKTGVALFVPKLAFTGESSSLQRWQFLLTENIRFCAFLPQYEGAVNENCTPREFKTIFPKMRGL